MRRFALIMFVLSALCAGHTAAQDLDANDVENFIVVMEEMEALSERYPEEDFSAGMDTAATDLSALVDEDGRMRIFARVAEGLGGPTEAQKAARKVITSNGFKSVAAWGEKADAILMAYMATEIDPAELAQMEQQVAQMTPEMMAMMPPGAKEQIEASLRMAKAVGDVPPGNIAALRHHRARLEAALSD